MPLQKLGSLAENDLKGKKVRVVRRDHNHNDILNKLDVVSCYVLERCRKTMESQSPLTMTQKMIRVLMVVPKIKVVLVKDTIPMYKVPIYDKVHTNTLSIPFR